MFKWLRKSFIVEDKKVYKCYPTKKEILEAIYDNLQGAEIIDKSENVKFRYEGHVYEVLVRCSRGGYYIVGREYKNK